MEDHPAVEIAHVSKGLGLAGFDSIYGLGFSALLALYDLYAV